ncbi:hypothetical protein A8B75_19625 [Sphingomonadales bacterium EhC05]|nr:hypothetical protein A8B75_19625 [Sphingomonadales bacterium EhC05]
MERPALQQLLSDVEAGEIDVVVVYKIDRLTRSLSDFAKIVDVLDKQNASFVSVTQSFNTQTSMGRLTLHVLLSFAQFEREVTAERIRDKFAASKRKGIWMGGPLPLGYNVNNRKLVVNEQEAEVVRFIYSEYMKQPSIRDLVIALEEQGIKTKVHKLKNGGTRGGVLFRRGSVRHLLGNATYIGRINHKGESYLGEHDSIVDEELWGAVQKKLADKTPERKRAERATHTSLLSGLLHDEHGRKMTPSHANKKGKRYRYYITHGGLVPKGSRNIVRLPAGDLEEIVVKRLVTHLGDRQVLIDKADGNAETLNHAIADADTQIDQLTNGTQHQKQMSIRNIVSRIDMDPSKLIIELQSDDQSSPKLEADYVHVRSGNDTKLVLRSKEEEPVGSRDEQLVQLIADSFKANKLANDHPNLDILKLADRFGRSIPRFKRLLRLSYLSPTVIESILSGEQPSDLTSTKLNHIGNLPIDWTQQQEMLGL